jgi:hypothetical protein
LGDSISITLFGLLKIDLPPATADSIRRRFHRRTLYGGPCMIIDRRWGLALDATTSPKEQTRPVLWTPHGAPWQQWRIERRSPELFKIVAVHGGRVLTTDGVAGDDSWVWLERDRDRDSQLWRMLPTDDRVAFQIEVKSSAHSIDSRTDAKVPSIEPDGSVDDPTSPILWSSHGAPWQQWLVLRVPLTW